MALALADRRMSLFEHLEDLRQRMKWSFLAVFILFVFFAGFHIQPSFPYIYPDPLDPFASQVFNLTLTYLKPDFVESAVTSPAEPFVVQLKTAFFLAVATGMPIVTYQMGKFVAPALYDRERKIVLRLVVPAVLLFVAGMLLSLFVVLPFTFRFLYSIAGNLGAQRLLLSLDQFLDFTLIFTLGFGLAFEIPVVMYALSAAGIVRAETWKKYWRIAVIGIFFFGAFITPDGSGVTMLLVSIPMCGLYVAGYVAARLHERRAQRPMSQGS